MNCYAGLAKRLVKSCFLEVKPHQVVPIPQLEPLDASKIIKPKSISDEEAWAVTVAWAEAKAQEREAAALKAVSETDTDESYDSDDTEVGVPIHPVNKKPSKGLFDDRDEDLSRDEDASGSEDDEEEYNPPLAAMAGLMRRGMMLEEKKAWNISDAAAAAAMWRDDAQADAYESVAVAKAMDALDKWLPSPRKYTVATIIQAAARGMCCRMWLRGTRRLLIERRILLIEHRHQMRIDLACLAATIIQAAARGRALRVWKEQFTHELAREMSHIWRARYHTRMGMDAVEQQLAEQWMVSPKCVKAWILQGEQRSISSDLPHVSVVYTTINHSALYSH